MSTAIAPARPAVSLPEPAPAVAARAPLHDLTPTGRPSWYGQRVGREERSWLSRTGDVELFAGNTFATGFPTAAAAIEHAASVSRTTGSGAVLVMDTGSATRDAAAGARWFLARCYNVEHETGQGLVMGHSNFDGGEKLTRWHPEVAYVVSGDRILTPPGH